MLFKTFLIVILPSIIQCSQVLDAEIQKGIYTSDYCPKMKYCLEGTHVMCMYYDRKKVKGPNCHDPRNVSMTAAYANKLVDVINALRSKVSRGLERGNHGEHLPRGYGIFRLRWDSELATFAQVLADQCVLRHDFCRATKRFPDPGQTASIVRFEGKDWIPVSKSGNFTTKGLTDEKLDYAITHSLKTWYGQKGSVTSQMVANYPDWSKNPSNQKGRLYLTMVYGSATHMGCGISAYTEYAFYNERASRYYNTVLVICNFSAQPRVDTGVYNTIPPTDTDSSFNSCGCPIGTMEDDDCLCLEIPRDHEYKTLQTTKTCLPGMNCDPTVVILPIFTMEDAPPDKLVASERFANTSTAHKNEKINDSFEELFDNNLSGNKGILRKSRKTLDLQQRDNTQRRALIHNGVTIRNRHFEKPIEAIEHKDSNHHDNNKPLKQSQGHMQRSSVFSKTPIFELPGSHYFTLKRDVVPRKDFTAGTEENDKKFMALLDTLEQEVKHIELRDKEKQIFDAKIKKIYGKVVGKPGKALIVSEKSHVENVKNVKDRDNGQKTEDDESAVHKLQPPFDIKDDDSDFIDELNYRNEQNIETEIDEKYPKTDITDVEPDEFEKPATKQQNSWPNYNGREKYSRRSRNFRQNNRNYLSSLEYLRHRYDNRLKARKTYKNQLRNDFDKPRHRSTSLDYKKHKKYFSNYIYDDVLSTERRNYYQDKLDSMERKLQDAKRFNRKKDPRRTPNMRAMKQSFRSDNQINSIYSGRARILHGY